MKKKRMGAARRPNVQNNSELSRQQPWEIIGVEVKGMNPCLPQSTLAERFSGVSQRFLSCCESCYALDDPFLVRLENKSTCDSLSRSGCLHGACEIFIYTDRTCQSDHEVPRWMVSNIKERRVALPKPFRHFLECRP